MQWKFIIVLSNRNIFTLISMLLIFIEYCLAKQNEGIKEGLSVQPNTGMLMMF